MPYASLTVLLTSDVGSEPQQIFQLRARVFLSQEQVLNFQKAGGDSAGVFTAMPSIEQSPELNLLILANDLPVNYKIASVTPGDGVLAFQAGGLLLAFNAIFNAGKTANVLINNVNVAGGATNTGAATITGAAGGT